MHSGVVTPSSGNIFEDNHTQRHLLMSLLGNVNDVDIRGRQQRSLYITPRPPSARSKGTEMFITPSNGLSLDSYYRLQRSRAPDKSPEVRLWGGGGEGGIHSESPSVRDKGRGRACTYWKRARGHTWRIVTHVTLFHTHTNRDTCRERGITRFDPCLLNLVTAIFRLLGH